MAASVNIWNINGTSPIGWQGGNPKFGDLARTSDGNIWMNIGDNQQASGWQLIGNGGELAVDQGLDVQEEGVNVVNKATKMNFIGADVTATGSGNTATVTVSGGGGASGTVLFNGTADLVHTDPGGSVSLIQTTGVGSPIIPANTLVDGSKIYIVVNGNILTSDGSSIAFNPNSFFYNINGNLAGGVDSYPAFVDNVPVSFRITIEFTFRNSTSSLVSGGAVQLQVVNPGSAIISHAFNTSSIVIDKTNPTTIDVFAGMPGTIVITTITSSVEVPKLA